MPPSIPDRWIPYKACGKVIEGTRIICFKVPLRKTVQKGKKEIREIWDIVTLLRTIPNLGAVIDLTNTTRYYNPTEFLKAGILHKKIYMPGRVIPPENKVQEFMNAVDEFLGKNDESLIGVHCTHGLNRTGYMVCRYMRDRMGFDAKDAVHRFEIARGYKIERDNYIADLMGEKPPSPDVGSSTELKPIQDPEDNEGDDLSKPTDSPHIESYSKSQKIRENLESGKSWRDEVIKEKEDYSNGQYVRHPYNNSWKHKRLGRSRCRQGPYNRRNYYTERNSSDSDKSYDYIHDY